MKTAEEVAEKILKELRSYGVITAHDWPFVQRIFIKALTSYAEERVKEAVKFNDGLVETSREMDRKVVQRLLKEARAEALEEAIDVVNAKQCGHQMDIEEKIRALKDSHHRRCEGE